MRVEAGMPVDYGVVTKGVKAVENKPPQTEESSPAVKAKQVKKAVAELNHFFSNYNLQFTMHQASGRYQVKMVDASSQEVIREWPADAILEVSARLKQILEEELGILLDTQI